jgi:hypothetical protein
VRTDGLIVQPDRPATFIDAMLASFLTNADTRGAPNGAVWTTSVALSTDVWHYALSIDLKAGWKLTATDFYPRATAEKYVLRRWHDGDVPAPCKAGGPAATCGCVGPAAVSDLTPLMNDRPIMVANDTHMCVSSPTASFTLFVYPRKTRIALFIIFRC